jgi:hypothetical protein
MERRAKMGFLEALLQTELEDRERPLVERPFAKRICRG